jgi:hypothetical protein
MRNVACMSTHATFPLTAETTTFFKLAFAFGVLVLGLELGYLLYSPFPYDPVGYLIGRDFANTWLGGSLALTGKPQTHFALDAYNGLLAERFGANYPLHIWSYPPHFLLFTWPFALLPYMLAYVVYCLAGLLVYLAVVTEGERRVDHLLLLVLAPAVTVNMGSCSRSGRRRFSPWRSASPGCQCPSCRCSRLARDCCGGFNGPRSRGKYRRRRSRLQWRMNRAAR